MSKKTLGALAWCFLIACFLWSGWVTFHATELLLDGDASSELVLSSLLAESGSILTDRWDYSTELRVINTQLVYTPLFRLFSDWHTVRFVGAMLMQAILLGSYAFFAQAVGISPMGFALTGGLMLLPSSVAYGRIVLYHCYYMPHLTLNFLLLGLFWRLSWRRTRAIEAGLYALLAIGAGLGGIRHGMITFFPLCLTMFARLRKDCETEGMVLGALKAERKPILWLITGSAAWLMGYAVNRLILSDLYHFADQMAMATEFPGANSFTSILLDFMRCFGFDSGLPLKSTRGLLACAGLAVCGLVMRQAFLTRRGGVGDAWTLNAFFLASLGTTIAALIVVTKYDAYQLYLLPAVVFALPAMVSGMEADGAAGARKRLLFGVVFPLALCISLYHTHFFLHPDTVNLRYGGLAETHTDIVPALEEPIAFLQEEGYTLGYAPFWYASVIRELTDGGIRTLALRSDGKRYNTEWLNQHALNDAAALAQEKAFYMTFEGLPMEDTRATRVYEDDIFAIYAFPDSEALYRYANP